MDRLPSETGPAYAAFKMFVEMGVDRSAREVSRRLDKSWSLISRWSTKHLWLERARAYDAHLLQVAQKAEEEKLTTHAGLWTQRMEQTREEAFQVAEELMAKARSMLRLPLVEQVTRDGKKVIKPARWTFSDAARMTDVANRLKRLATGLPTERLEHSGGRGTAPEGPVIEIQEIEAVVFDQMRREILFQKRDQEVVEQPKSTPDASLPGKQ